MKHAPTVAAMLAAFLFVLFATPAHGACVTPERVAAFTQTNNPDAERVAELSKSDADKFLAHWNELPPVTQIWADLVWVYDDRGNTTVLIILFDRGCLKALDEQPKALFRRTFPDIELLTGRDA